MIASLCGIVRHVGADHLVIETGGIGLLVYAPRPAIQRLGTPGDEVFVHTVLVVREDALTLYGFATPEQRALFETLIGISGVGPRMAVNLLSFAEPDEVRVAVAQKDTARFVKVPGIGKKMAERLVLELQSKLDVKDIPAAAATSADPAVASVNSELVNVLVSLGYSSAEAQSAVAALPADAPAELEERLRLALKHFGGV